MKNSCVSAELHNYICPLIHQPSTLLEQVASLIGLFDSIPSGVHQTLFCEDVVLASFCTPITKRRPAPVHRHGVPKPNETIKLSVIERSPSCLRAAWKQNAFCRRQLLEHLNRPWRKRNTMRILLSIFSSLGRNTPNLFL